MIALACDHGALDLKKAIIEKNHVAPPSSQDEALSRYSASGEVPR